MIRIGILTFHNAKNYGAVLQAFALKEFLVKYTGNIVEIINYKNPKIEQDNRIWKKAHGSNWFKESLRNVLMLMYNIKLSSIFRQYVKNKLTSSKEVKAEWLSKLQYDLYIVGSDQVWNKTITNNDKAFFLDFVNSETLCASYAASIGNSSFPEEEIPIYHELLSRFAMVSLREKECVPFVSEVLGNREINTSLDPVFLFDASFWDAQSGFVESKEPYVLFVSVGHPSDIGDSLDYARSLARKLNYKLLYLSNQDIWYKNRDLEHLGAVSPEKYISYIKNSAIVVTNSFHATSFSILFHREFYTEIGRNRSGRIKNLLELTGLMNRAICRGGVVERQKGSAVNWEEVDRRIETERNRSILYINRLVSLVE